MSKSITLPPSVTKFTKDVLLTLKKLNDNQEDSRSSAIAAEYYGVENIDEVGRPGFVFPESCRVYTTSKEALTRVSAAISYMANKTPWVKMDHETNGWILTKDGQYVAENINSIKTRYSKEDDPNLRESTRPAPASKAQKKPLSEIEPIPAVFKPNLSKAGSLLAELSGSLLDENQQYRDFLKHTLNQLATFLGATVTYPHDEDKDNESSQEK